MPIAMDTPSAAHTMPSRRNSTDHFAGTLGICALVNYIETTRVES
jgi:hypothetical protein